MTAASSAWKPVLWRQMGAAIDMLENAIRACPDSLWDDGSEPPNLYWYGAYHCLFYLDVYSSETDVGFAPPPPFTLSEFDPSGAMPPRTYSKDELLGYLEHCRAKCRARIEQFTDADLKRRCGFALREMPAVEIIPYTMRHVVHHMAQLNLLLRQKAGKSSPWVNVSKTPWVATK